MSAMPVACRRWSAGAAGSCVCACQQIRYIHTQYTQAWDMLKAMATPSVWGSCDCRSTWRCLETSPNFCPPEKIISTSMGADVSTASLLLMMPPGPLVGAAAAALPSPLGLASVGFGAAAAGGDAGGGAGGLPPPAPPAGLKRRPQCQLPLL